MNARAAAALTLEAVAHRGQSLDAALVARLDRVPGAQQGLYRELCYGTLRWQPRLAFLIDRLLERPLKARDRVIGQLLMLGLYQLEGLRTPDHAAVSETAAATRELGRPWASGLVNAVLRGFVRRREALLAMARSDLPARTAHPRWLAERIAGDWPEDWPAILDANNRHPPMTLRVHTARNSREDYLARLEAAGVHARPGAHAPAALVLAEPRPVRALPGFGDGLVSVQDAAAQLAAPLLAPLPGDRVLDACAAPGGKTCHLLELEPEARLWAIERDPGRLAGIRQNLARLGLDATVRQGDAGAPEAWWDGVPFDRILIDAPCTASGVVRRHPDIKLLRRPRDVASAARRQRALLAALWPLLKPGGVLLYATCSILREENEAPIAALLAENAGAAERPIDAPWGRPCRHGRQVLPGEHGMDGFYYARLTKVPGAQGHASTD